MSESVEITKKQFGIALAEFSSRKFTGQAEFLIDMNQGGITRLRMRTLTSFGMSLPKEGNGHGRNSDNGK